MCQYVFIVFPTMVVSLIAASAAAAPAFYTTRSPDFIAAAGGGLVSEGFDVAFASGSPRTFGPMTLLHLQPPRDFEFTADPRFTSGGAGGVLSSIAHSTGADAVRFTFASPVTAFGIDVIDVGNGLPGGDTVEIVMSTDTGGLFSFAIPPAGRFEGNVAFMGAVDNVQPFSSVVFGVRRNGGAATDAGSVSFDEVQYRLAPIAAAVPEPATALMLATGLTVCPGIRRRRQ